MAAADHRLGAGPNEHAGAQLARHLGRHALRLGRVLRGEEHEGDVSARAAEAGPDGRRRVGRGRRGVGREPGGHLHCAPDGRHSMILQSVETSAVVEAEMKQSRWALPVSSRADAA